MKWRAVTNEPPPPVSIIIPVHNGARTLGACLDGCTAQNVPIKEIIVVDDGSTDATPGIASEHDVIYLRQDQRGPAAARNAGAQRASGEFIAFTDADCVPQPDWIAHLLESFDNGVAAAGGTYGNASGRSWLASLIHEEIQARHARFGREVDFLGSFNVMYRRELFQRVGGFDESFRTASGEDNDLAYRLQDAGGKLAFTPHAVVAHHHPTGLAQYLRTQARHGYWRMKLYQKHPGRLGGDHYAGLRDFAGVGLPLAIAAHAAAAAFTWSFPPLAIALTLSLAVYAPAFAWLHADLARDLARRTRRPAAWFFWLVMVLRDFARCVGLIAGLWRFRIKRAHV